MVPTYHRYVFVWSSLSEDEPMEEGWEDEGQQDAAAGPNQCHERGELRDGQDNEACHYHQSSPEDNLREGGREGVSE